MLQRSVGNGRTELSASTARFEEFGPGRRFYGRYGGRSAPFRSVVLFISGMWPFVGFYPTYWPRTDPKLPFKQDSGAFRNPAKPEWRNTLRP
jgi:hypothetical protein